MRKIWLGCGFLWAFCQYGNVVSAQITLTDPWTGETYQSYEPVPVPDPVWACCSAPITGPHAPGCRYNQPTTNTNSGSSSGSTPPVITTEQMVQNMLIEAAITWLFTPSQPSPEELQRQAAAEAQRIQDSIHQQEVLAAQEALRIERENQAYQQLMESSKMLADGAVDLDFKNLNGEAEQLAANAAAQFAPAPEDLENYQLTGGTPFFGSVMTDAQIMTVMSPETDPVYLDVMTADSYMVANLKKEDMPVEEQVVRDDDGNGEPIEEERPVYTPEQCTQLENRLGKYEYDQSRFYAWNQQTKAELQSWSDQNDQAFWNAVNEAASFAFGELFNYAIIEGKKAERVAELLKEGQVQLKLSADFSPEQLARMTQMVQNRMNLQYLNMMTGQIAMAGKAMNTAMSQTSAVTNLLQSVSNIVSTDDAEYNEFVRYLTQQGLLSNYPTVDFASFIASKGLNYYLKELGYSKVPYVAIASTAVKQTYNAMSWYLSYENVVSFRAADGQATEAAIQLQNTINDIRYQLSFCHQNKVQMP